MTKEHLPNAESIREQLVRILSSKTFRGVPPLRKLLKHVVEAKLEGHVGNLKLTSIAHDIFDDRDDLVRTTATRLRAKLLAYYHEEGSADRVRIDMPTGHYVPTFTLNDGGTKHIGGPHLGNDSIRGVSDAIGAHSTPIPRFELSESASRKLRAPDPLAERRAGLRDNLIVGGAVETLVHSTLNSMRPAPLCGWDPARVTIIDTGEVVDSKPILARLAGGLLPLGPDEANNVKFVLSECAHPFKDDEENLTLSFRRTDWQTHKTVRNAADGVEHNEDLALEFGSLDVERNRVPSSVGLHYVLRFSDDSILLMKRRRDIAHDANRWSISGEEQFEQSDFLNNSMLRVFQRTLCEEVFGLLERNPERLQDRWDKYVARYVQSMRLWSLVFEERACVTSLLGFYQLGISVNEFATLRKGLAQQCVGTRDYEGTVYWTTTGEIEQLLVRNQCRAWLLDGTDVATVESSMLGKTSRYRAFRAVRAIRGVLPEMPDGPFDSHFQSRSMRRSDSTSPEEVKADDFPMRLPTSVGEMDRGELLSYQGGYVDAICLFGRAGQYVPPERLFIDYEHTPYRWPQELESNGRERIARLERDARLSNSLFFNGPNVRLMRWHHNQTPPAELHKLDLVFGCASWYDLEGTNGLVREMNSQAEFYSRYVDLRQLKSGNIVEGCKLSNVIGNAVTIFTSDGKVGFQIRGQRQSAVPGKRTSAVAENVNRYRDEVHKGEEALNSAYPDSALARDANYRPTGTPHPLAAVRRGLASEASPRILDYVGPYSIKVTGLTFGLDCLAPDLLWIALVDLTENRFQQLRHEHSGDEFDEGVIEFVPAVLNHEVTRDVLKRPDWVPAGKASLIRAIQLIGEAARDPVEAFGILARAR